MVFQWRGNVFQDWVFIFWCGMVFSEVSFSFSHCSSNTPVVAICFGAQALTHVGFGREKKTKGVMFIVGFVIVNLE